MPTLLEYVLSMNDDKASRHPVLRAREVRRAWWPRRARREGRFVNQSKTPVIRGKLKTTVAMLLLTPSPLYFSILK